MRDPADQKICSRTGQDSCGTVEFTVKARLAKGPFFGSGDGMVRAMGLVQDIGGRHPEGSLRNTMTVTMITGRSVNEVTVTCGVLLLPGFKRDDLEPLLDELSRKWDCGYRIVSLSPDC